VAGYSVTYSVVDNATKQIDQINRRITQMRAPVERMGKSLSRFVDVSGLRKVGDAFGWIARSAAGAFRSIVAIVPALGAITSAATIAGMAKLVGHFAEWGATLQTNAHQLDINADQLQRLEHATSRAGGSAEDMVSSLKALQKAQADSIVSGGPALAAFNELHISARDANGQLKSTPQLLGEVLKGLDKYPQGADRARIAGALLGDEQGKLYEAFRLSGKSYEEWVAAEADHPILSKEQLEGLNQYRLAMAGLTTTFGGLGEQISATLAKNLTPFLKHLDDFVQKHQPEILAAIDAISTRFGNWLSDPSTWAAFEQGAHDVVTALKLVIDNLDTITTMAEVIAGIFAAKWALGIVGSIAQVVTAIGTVSGGTAAAAAGGTGLLGALGSVAIVASALGAAALVHKGLEKGSDYVEGKVFGEDRVEGRKQMQEQGASQFWGALGDLGRRMWNGPEAIQRQSMNLPEATVQRGAAIRDKLATDLNLTPAQASGIVGNLQAESGLKAVQERNPIGGGRGGFGWAQWTGPRRREFEAYAKEQHLDPKSDEANYGFLLKELKSPEYAAMLAKLRAQQGSQAAQTSAAIVEHDYERPAVSNAGTRMSMAGQIAAGPPAAPPPPAGTINGAVDVSITHSNPPPDATVTAKGSGSVNVQPLRTERPQVNFSDV
jgi:hypothetical protein